MKFKFGKALVTSTMIISLLFSGCNAKTTGTESESETKKIEDTKETSSDTKENDTVSSFDGKSKINEAGTGLDVAYGTMEKKEVTEPVEFTILRAWNGSSSNEPIIGKDLVAPVLKEKFNTTINWEFCVGSETEKLTLAFASGDMPDFIDFPLWGGTTGETGVIKKAIKDELLRPIDGFMETYAPTVAENMYREASEKYITRELENPIFEGKHYFIPRETVYNPEEDTINWLYGVYIRKDIAKALNFDNKTGIKNIDDLTKLMGDIKAGNFKDVNGNDIIVATTGSKGFSFDYYLRPLDMGNNSTDLYFDEKTNSVKFKNMDKEDQFKKVDIVRNWVKNGYIDTEAFTQENVQVEVKITNGSTGLIVNNGFALIDKSLSLYDKNPDMEYIPVGVPNINGDVYSGYQPLGRDGTPAWCVTESASDDELIRFLEIMEYINQPEGQTLITFGIEDQTFKYDENKKPMYLPEYEAYANGDMRKLTEMGIGGGTGSGEISSYGIFVVADKKPFKKEVPTTQTEIRKAEYNEIIPIKWKPNGLIIDNWNNDYDLDKREAFNLAHGDFAKVKQAAYYASTDEEAKKILNEWYDKVTPLYEDFEKFINEKVNAYDGELLK